MSTLKRLIFRLRLEEAVALVFLLPTTYFTFRANLYVAEEGILGARFPGGGVRLAFAFVFLFGLAAALKLWPAARWPRALREVLPFLTCILIYTNLHDTIGFVNSHDVHDKLIAFDEWLLGTQPSMWAESLITHGRTEAMSFFYMNFVWMAPSTSAILLALRRFSAFRAATVGVLVCFFVGYFLYVLFPAAPPRLVLADQYTVNLMGYQTGFAAFSERAFELLPVDSRAAFPSLHTAVSLVALIYAWRFLRVWFWVLLPFVLGLWTSTIYLRHHYFVDLVAGWLLAPLAVALAPCLDRAWASRQRALGLPVALGAVVPRGNDGPIGRRHCRGEEGTEVAGCDDKEPLLRIAAQGSRGSSASSAP